MGFPFSIGNDPFDPIPPRIRFAHIFNYSSGRSASTRQYSDEDDGIAVDADLDLCNGDVDGDDNSSDGFVLSVDLSVGNHIV